MGRCRSLSRASVADAFQREQACGKLAAAQRANDNARLRKNNMDSEQNMDLEKIAAGVRLILEGIGEDVQRDGLRETPQRVAEMYAEVCGGLHEQAEAELKVIPSGAPEGADEDLVMVKDIAIASICEHHLVPFTGVVHIGYIPQNGRIVGLSKLARIAEIFARRPQVQERLTTQIAELLYRGPLQPKGVLVVMEAEHLCMVMRGIKKHGTSTVTSAMRGVFRDNERARNEALTLLRGLPRS
jgi:GTP cyclohydrolase IA